MRRFCERLIAAAAVVASLAAMSGCVAAKPARPDPVEVVQEYLTAISEGDAERASELDGLGVEVDNTWIARYADFGTLRTDDVLQAAGRIEDVVIEHRSHAVDGDEDLRWVGFTYRLGEQKGEASIRLRWSEAEAEWRLESSFTLELYIDAEVSTIHVEAASFRVGGAADPVIVPPDEPFQVYIVYPGIYTIVAEFPDELLAAGETRTHTVTADYPGDASTTFTVTRLPSE